MSVDEQVWRSSAYWSLDTKDSMADSLHLTTSCLRSPLRALLACPHRAKFSDTSRLRWHQYPPLSYRRFQSSDVLTPRKQAHSDPWEACRSLVCGSRGSCGSYDAAQSYRPCCPPASKDRLLEHCWSRRRWKCESDGQTRAGVLASSLAWTLSARASHPLSCVIAFSQNWSASLESKVRMDNQIRSYWSLLRGWLTLV